LRWQQAKIIFNTADSNFHELISHLGRTHLLLEPFVVATSKLPKGHAIKDIVTVHLEGTAFINELAIDTLVALGGPVDQLLMGELASELQKLTVASIKEPGFNGLMLKKFLSDRGLLNAPLDYPYRDDALKLWDATYKWMTAYVDVFYKSDDDVRNDADLQIWAKSLASKDGGQLNGFGEYDRPGVLTTKWYLVDVLTMIAFTGGCQHAAVNFAQYGFMAFAPLAPLAGYKDPDDRINSPVEMFPPISQALSQLNVVGLLGRVYYTTYGKYTQGFAENEALKAPLNKFWKELDAIEASIEKRNKKAKFPYPYLIPSKIPQSINI
jgi:arachidonate 15-lipoxygenase